MDITPLVSESAKIIQSYGHHRFKVSGDVFEGSIIVLANQVLAWKASSTDHISIESLQPFLSLNLEEPIEILLIGAGKQMVYLPPEFRQALKALGMTVDCMDTGAACRTYNVLLSEGRRVATALISVE